MTDDTIIRDHAADELADFLDRFRLERADVRAALAGALASAAADLSVGLGLPLDGPRPPKGVSA